MKKRISKKSFREAFGLPVIRVTNQKELNAAQLLVERDGKPRLVEMIHCIQ